MTLALFPKRAGKNRAQRPAAPEELELSDISGLSGKDSSFPPCMKIRFFTGLNSMTCIWVQPRFCCQNPTGLGWSWRSCRTCFCPVNEDLCVNRHLL